MHQHTRRHHRYTQRLWRQRRRRMLLACWFWMELRIQDVDTHAPKRLYGRKTNIGVGSKSAGSANRSAARFTMETRCRVIATIGPTDSTLVNVFRPLMPSRIGGFRYFCTSASLVNGVCVLDRHTEGGTSDGDCDGGCDRPGDRA